MASSASICCGGGRASACVVRCDRRTFIVRPLCVAPVTNRRSWVDLGRISMTTGDFAPPPDAKLIRTSIGERKRGGSIVSREKIGEWLKDSVVEIIKNLRESPLLVHLYSEENGGLSTSTTEAEEDWEAMEERTPEGVIFVEKLADDDDHDGEGTSAWGIVAHGRGTDCGPVCYLLKTTRVGSGLGTVCTHYCLVKVRSFRETDVSQLNNSWLVQTGQ